MAYDDNIYGMQKTPETEVRDGWEIAGTTTAAAAQGAEIGSEYGAAGAMAGAVAGGAMGFIGAGKAQAKEAQYKRDDIVYNNFVDSLSGRDYRTTNMVQTQARYGMANNRYRTDVVEVEGDGSGDPVNGIGEVHVDKNYNIKNVAAGAPRHEEGGLKLPANIGDGYLKEMSAKKGLKIPSGAQAGNGSPEKSLEKGDIIFPWQDDVRKYDKGMSMIRRYKLNGDPRAKKWLDREVDSLPTDEDYGYAEKGMNKYPNGTSGATLPQKNEQYYADIPSDEDQDSSGGSVVTGAGSSEEKKQVLENPTFSYNKDDGDSYEYKLNNQTGEVFTKLKTGSKWTSIKEQEAKGMANKNKWDKEAPKVSNDITRTRKFGEWAPPTTATGNSVSINQPGMATPNVFSPNATAPQAKMAKLAEPIPEDLEYGKIDKHNNPMKYASALNNLVQGTKAHERPTRRYYTPEQYQYNDRSYSQRRAAAEDRNYAGQMLRGKGLSIGQQQGYMGQASARYRKANEAINENEARRNDQIDFANVGGTNQAKQLNLNLANQYDDIESRNKAAKQAYLDQFYGDVASLGQISEQRDYMIDRNNKQYQMDGVKLDLMRDIYPNYYINEEDPGNVRFRSSDYS